MSLALLSRTVVYTVNINKTNNSITLSGISVISTGQLHSVTSFLLMLRESSQTITYKISHRYDLEQNIEH